MGEHTCYKQHIQNLLLPCKHFLWHNVVFISPRFFLLGQCVSPSVAYSQLLFLIKLLMLALPSPYTSLRHTFTCDRMNGVERRGTHHVYSKQENVTNYYSNEEVDGQRDRPISAEENIKVGNYLKSHHSQESVTKLTCFLNLIWFIKVTSVYYRESNSSNMVSWWKAAILSHSAL